MANLLTRLGLDVDRLRGETEQLCKSLPDPRLDGAEFRLLGEEDHIHIDRSPTLLVQPPEGAAEEQDGIGVAPGGVGVWVGIANIAETGGPEQGVGQGMKNDVGVTVAIQPARILDADTAENKRTPF